MRLTTTLLTFLLFGSTVTCAQAALIGPAADYNVFVFGNFTSEGDTEGNLAAGGNVSLQGYSVASTISGPSARLVAGGNVTATNGGVGDGQNGTIYTGGSAKLTSFTARGGVLPQTLVDFSTAQSQYQNLSTSLGALTANGSTSVYSDSDSLTLNLTGGNAGLNIFSINGDDLKKTKTVNIDVSTGSTVLINVTGSEQSLREGQVFFKNVDATHVIYNFSDATKLNLANKDLLGTVLAPFANVTGGYGQFNGQLIAQSFDGNTEFHNVKFAGNLPAIVPIPAAVWLFGSALGLLGFMAGKRRF